MADHGRTTDGTQRLLITGAAGQMGQLLRPLLRRPNRALRLADIRDIGPAMPGEEMLNVDITDPGSIVDACRDVDAVLHLAGISSEAPFDEVVQVNVKGTRNLFQAAVGAGVRCIVLASSNHAAGFYRRSDVATDSDDLGDDLPPRPDTFYGWSKAACESLGAVYHHRYGIDVVALRIGTFSAEPADIRSLTTWLAPVDAARLVEACLAAPRPGFRVIWAISDNTRKWWSLMGAASLGYDPIEDAERFAPTLISQYGELYHGDPGSDLVGGEFCVAPLGEPMP